MIKGVDNESRDIVSSDSSLGHLHININYPIANFQESQHTGSGVSKMTSVDERVMDTVGRNTANVRGLNVQDCAVSFAPSTLVSSADLLVFPQSSEVTAEVITHQDTAQAGPSGFQSTNSRNTI